jgi:uncharacterized protein YybS (DUF2232 family)
MAVRQLPWQVMSGLAALLILQYSAMQLPVVGLLLGALVPLPIILTISRAGWWAGLLVAGGALAVNFYIGQISTLRLEALPLLHLTFLAAALAWLASRAYPAEAVIGGAALGGMIIQVGLFVFMAYQQGLKPLAYLEQTVTSVWSDVSHLLDQGQGLEKELAQLDLTMADLLSWVVRLTPAMLFVNNTLVALVNYLCSRALNEPGPWAPPKVPLPCWEAPGWLVFVLIGTGFALLVPSQVLQVVALNLLLVCLLLYFLQGVAIIAFGFQRYQVPRLLRWTIYLLLILLKPAMVLVILMGVTDLWLDYRRLHQPPSEV